MLLTVLFLLCLNVYGNSAGDDGCQFPVSWTGRWFQSGFFGLIAINSTHIHSKGDCAETDGKDKFLVYDRSDDCYRCLVIHEKHKNVLRYKESYCSLKDSFSSICDAITVDALTYTMIRKEPQATHIGTIGECTNPVSHADSCTDNMRMLLRFASCPDVPGTENKVEELVCLATWMEGSTRYLVGQISQVQRRNSLASDEDTYRCFIYEEQQNDGIMTYTIAQSGDATCYSISSPYDGQRTMFLTNGDDKGCHFPNWIVDHHKWFTFDHSHQYQFSTKNATFKILHDDGSHEEQRVVCHSILEQKEQDLAIMVAHVVNGCESGYVCLTYQIRGVQVLGLMQGSTLWESPQDACKEQDPMYITLISEGAFDEDGLRS